MGKGRIPIVGAAAAESSIPGSAVRWYGASDSRKGGMKIDLPSLVSLARGDAGEDLPSP